MRCERARVPTYVWERNPGEKRALSKQESRSSADGSGFIRVCFGNPLKPRQCRDVDHIDHPLFGRPSVTQASVHRWAFGANDLELWGQVTE